MSLQTRRLEDPGAELLDRVTGFWGRYGRVATIVLGAVVVVGAGAFFTLRSRAAAEEQAASKFAEANILFWQGDYARSQQVAKQVSTEFAQTPSGVDAHRLAGDDAFWQGNFKEAIAEYRRFLDQKKTGLISDAVRRSLAYSLESDQQFKDAEPIYLGLVGVFERESSAEFLAAAARCERNMNHPQEAAKLLNRLLDEYGETSYANRARMELAGLTNAPR